MWTQKQTERGDSGCRCRRAWSAKVRCIKSLETPVLSG